MTRLVLGVLVGVTPTLLASGLTGVDESGFAGGVTPPGPEVEGTRWSVDGGVAQPTALLEAGPVLYILLLLGGFCWNCLGLWLAIHGSVAVDSILVRMLVVELRLPIPTEESVESCQTDCADYERDWKKVQ